MGKFFQAKILIPILIVVDLLVVRHLPISALAFAGYDDQLFVRLGTSISQGKWLGDYDKLILAKGAGYPLFLAVSYLLHVPEQYSLQFLNILFCFAAVLALSPVIKGNGAGIFLFAILLFNPANFPVDDFSRVNRSAIYAAQSGLCLALAAGIWLRRTRPALRLLPWSIALGLALGFFWITREEGIWLVPSLGLIIGWTLAGLLLRRSPGWALRAVTILLAPVISAAVVCGVATTNKNYYGRFITVEFNDPAFLAAYGALTRVKPTVHYPQVPVTVETRRRLYSLSPAFAELRPYLEGDDGKAWVAVSKTLYPQFKGEITGGWFMWAFRSAVADAGHANTATAAHDFYAKMADEINAACDQNKVAAWPRSDRMFPRGQKHLLSRIRLPAWRGLLNIISFHNFTVEIPASAGTPDYIKSFSHLTLEKNTPTDVSLTTENSANLRLISWMIFPYRMLGAIWTWTSLAAMLLLTIGALRGLARPLWLLEIALLGAITVRLVMLALIRVTSFPVFILSYTSCIYPLVLWFNALVTFEVAALFCHWFRQSQITRNPSSTTKTAA